jgi:hemerythrin
LDCKAVSLFVTAGRPVFSGILDSVRRRVQEEQLQKKYGYPDYENHKKLHDGIKKIVRDLQVQLIMKGPSDALFDDVKVKVGDWLIAHIKSQDTRIAVHLKSQGVS